MFDELDIPATDGAQIMSLLGLQIHQLKDPVTFRRVQDVMSYLHDVPDKGYFIRRITTGKNVDKLNHVWSYVELKRRQEELGKTAEFTRKELNQFSEKDASGDLTEIERNLARDSMRVSSAISSELNKVQEELYQYEK